MATSSEQIRSGNRCGHHPLNPRLDLPKPPKTGKGGLPRVLTLAAELLDGFYSNPNLIPSLNFANLSDRDMRSERREACIISGKALLARTDLVTLMVKMPSRDGLVDVKFEKIIEETGLGEKRFYRAITDLKNAGCIKVCRTWEEKTEGEKRALPAIKSISRKLFAALGLETMLKYERDKAAERAKNDETKRLKKEAKRSQESKARIELMQDAAQRRIATAKPDKPKIPSLATAKPEERPPPTPGALNVRSMLDTLKAKLS